MVDSQEPVRYRLNTHQERELRGYLTNADTACGMLRGTSYEGSVTGEREDFAPSDSVLARAVTWRRVDETRRELLALEGGAELWAVLRAAYLVESPPAPTLEEKYPGHPDNCRFNCTCAEDLEGWQKAWKRSVDARRVAILSPLSPKARERGIERARASQFERVATAIVAQECERAREAETVPQGMTTAHRVFAHAASAVVPMALVYQHAAEAVMLAGSSKAEREWLLEVKAEALEALLDSEDAWVRARMVIVGRAREKRERAEAAHESGRSTRKICKRVRPELANVVDVVAQLAASRGVTVLAG